MTGTPMEHGLKAWLHGGESCRFIHNDCPIDIMFKSEYVRNNRSSGHKNVRCFPHCCGAHRESTFCGSSITVQGCENHIVYGRFEESEDNANTKPRVKLGTTIQMSDILNDEKTSANPFGMWMSGTPIGNHQYEINKSKLSWHYGWVSSRFNSKTLHRFQVYFFQQISPQQVKCIGMIASPSFSLCSSRKTRKKAVNTPTNAKAKVEPIQSPEPTPPIVKAEPIPPPLPPPTRVVPPSIKIEIPSIDSLLRHDLNNRPRTFSGHELSSKRHRSDDPPPRYPISPTPSTFSFSSFLRPYNNGGGNNPSSPVPSTTNSCTYSFSSFLPRYQDKQGGPSSPVPSSAPSCAFSFSSFLRPANTCPQKTVPQSPKPTPGSPVPSTVPSGVVTLFSDLIKDDFCRKSKECKRISRYDYVDRAICLSQIHALASTIISFSFPDGKWNCLVESHTPLENFVFRSDDWESKSVYKCRPRDHPTEETYEQVLTFCINAMRHCIRTGMIGRLRSFLHTHASSIFKPELLDQAYADFITFFEQEIESYVFPRKRMQCAAFLQYLRDNLPMEMISLIDVKSDGNEPLGYFELVTQLRQVYQFVKSEDNHILEMKSSPSRLTSVTGYWRRQQAPSNSGGSWFYRVLGSIMLKRWTLVDTPSELLMKFDESLNPCMTPYLLNGDPMFLSFSPIGLSSGGMQGRAMTVGYKAWRTEDKTIIIQWHNWPRGKKRRRFTRTLFRSKTDPDILCSRSTVEETPMTEEELSTFSDLNLSERINFPGEWSIVLEEDTTFIRIQE